MAATVADDHLGLRHPLAPAPFPGRDRIGLAPEPPFGGPGLGLELGQLPVGGGVLPLSVTLGTAGAAPTLSLTAGAPVALDG